MITAIDADTEIFSQTVTFYEHPGDDLTATWEPEIFVSDLTSPSDMWWTDVDGDGAVDLVSADHTAHRGVWHRNTGVGGGNQWTGSSIYRNINMPGDFAMVDIDGDGDEDWVGVSMTLGQAFIVERVDPPESLVVELTLPDDLTAPITRLVVTLAEEIPVTGIDFIVKAPTEPDYWFIEANERPGLANHEPQPTAQRFVDLLFPQSVPATVRASLAFYNTRDEIDHLAAGLAGVREVFG